MAQVLIVFRSALISIMVSGTRDSMIHQNRRSIGWGSSSFFSPTVEVVAMVKAAPSRVVARNSRVIIQKITINTGPAGSVLSTWTID